MDLTRGMSLYTYCPLHLRKAKDELKGGGESAFKVRAQGQGRANTLVLFN